MEKILFVTSFYHEPPRQNVGLLRFAEELSKYTKIIIISSQIGNAKNYEKKSKNLRIYRIKPWLYLKSLPYVFTPFLFRNFIEIYRKEKIDIVITVSEQFWPSITAAFVKKFLKFPLFVWMHGISKETGRGFLLDFMNKINDQIFSRFVIKSADEVFILANAMSERAITLGAREKNIIVVPIGIDTNEFRPSIEFSHLKKEFGIKNNEKIITFLGRLFPLKGTRYFVEASKNILKKYPNSKFILLGDGPQKNELIKLTEKINYSKFIFPGYREKDLGAFLNLSDIMVLPSLSEGLPNAILEAYACGIPVVATDVGGVRDILKNNLNGYLIKPKDSEAIVKGVLKILKNKKIAQKMGKHNRNFVVANYSISKVVKRFLKILKKLKNQ